jgi:hypothetical protein
MMCQKSLKIDFKNYTHLCLASDFASKLAKLLIKIEDFKSQEHDFLFCPDTTSLCY